MPRNMHLLTGVSMERISEEVLKGLDEAESKANYFRLLSESGLIYDIFPELAGMTRTYHDSRGTHYGESVYQHILDVLERADHEGHRGPDLLLAIILHDSGKMQTVEAKPDGKIMFIGHDEVGAQIAYGTLLASRFSGNIAIYVSRVIKQHMTMNQISLLPEETLRKTLARFFVFDIEQSIHLLYSIITLSELDTNGKHATVRMLADEMFGMTGPEPLIKGKDTLRLPEKIRGKLLKQMLFLQLSQRLDRPALKDMMKGEALNIIIASPKLQADPEVKAWVAEVEEEKAKKDANEDRQFHEWLGRFAKESEDRRQASGNASK